VRLPILEKIVLPFCLCALLMASSVSAQESSAVQSGKAVNSQAESETSTGAGSPAAQEPAARPQLPPVIASISPEDMKKYMNFDEFMEKGWDVNWTPTAESLLRDVGGFRSALYKHGFGFYAATQNTFNYNLAQPPQPKPQVFIGQRPNFAHQLDMFLTYNIPSKHIQFALSSGTNYSNWPAGMGPNFAKFYGLSYYQSFLNDKIQVKAGYLHNTLEFIGLQVAGSLAQGSLGPKGVLPFEVGLSTSTPTPGVNVRYNVHGNFYGKTGFQRSVAPVNDAGATEDRSDAVGFRFHRKGDGLLTIQEVGYKRDASPSAHQMWIRAGGLYNTSSYPFVDPRDNPPGVAPTLFSNNNWNVFFEADRQFIQFEKMLPFRGIYGGAVYQYDPPGQNFFTQDREVRVYALGLFRNRPFDMMVLDLGNTVFSNHWVQGLNAFGQPTYSDTTAVTGTWSFLVTHGIFFNTAIGYTRHPFVTPRLDSPVTLTLQVWAFL
jgi:porin